jgi:hypothetical protein
MKSREQVCTSLSVIDCKDNHAILFRGNNAAPRIITAFIHAQADTYLKDNLGPLISEAIRDPRLHTFSTASNISSSEREANLRYIQIVAKRFLDAIVNSADTLPAYISDFYPLTLVL